MMQSAKLGRLLVASNRLPVVIRRQRGQLQAEAQLQNYLYQQKTEEAYVEWLDVLRAQTYIERKGAFGG